MNYDIFISYRKTGTADKAEHLFTLLENDGYKGRVSFDKENFDGRFDLEILRRLDNCKDFIVVLSQQTLCNLKYEDTSWYKALVNCSIEEFSKIEKQMTEAGTHLDFVRLEIGRAIAKKKHIIPVVPANNDDYRFDKLSLPDDISLLLREQAVKYEDSNEFLFMDVMPKIKKRLKSKPVNKLLLKCACAAFAFVMVLFCIGAYLKWNNEKTEFVKCRSLLDYETFENKSFFYTSQCKDSMMLFNVLSTKYVPINDACNTDCEDSIKVLWNKDCSLQQIRILRKMINYMMFVEKGEFFMGADKPFGLIEKKHAAFVDDDFYIGKFEVTEREWNVVMNDNDTGNDRMPKTGISWHDAQKFVRKLQYMTGLLFSLPSEMQWEYAAKKNGNNDWCYAGSSNAEDVAVFEDNSNGCPEHIDVKSPNALELYNMSGNVSEWCEDGDEYKRAIRGGSFMSSKKEITVYFVDRASISNRCEYIGMRLVINS